MLLHLRVLQPRGPCRRQFELFPLFHTFYAPHGGGWTEVWWIGAIGALDVLVEGSGFGVWGLGFGVWGVGCGVWGLGCEVRGLGLGVCFLGFGFWVWGLGFGVEGSGLSL